MLIFESTACTIVYFIETFYILQILPLQERKHACISMEFFRTYTYRMKALDHMRG